jgi:hypothetical protein
MAEPFRTPDGRYIIVRRRLWRATNPQLDEQERKAYVSQLMTARRKVKMALKSGDEAELKAARAGVQAAKVALGERGPVWWDDGAPDYNRHMVHNTPYAEWFAEQLEDE